MNYMISMVVVMFLSMGIGYILATLRRSEPKNVGDLYIFDSETDAEFGPTLLVQLVASVDDLDLQNNESIIMRVADRRKKTRK